jgi:hypothetical protein
VKLVDRRQVLRGKAGQVFTRFFERTKNDIAQTGSRVVRLDYFVKPHESGARSSCFVGMMTIKGIGMTAPMKSAALSAAMN